MMSSVSSVQRQVVLWAPVHQVLYLCFSGWLVTVGDQSSHGGVVCKLQWCWCRMQGHSRGWTGNTGCDWAHTPECALLGSPGSSYRAIGVRATCWSLVVSLLVWVCGWDHAAGMCERTSLKILHHRWSEGNWPIVIQGSDVSLLWHWHNNGWFQALWDCCQRQRQVEDCENSKKFCTVPMCCTSRVLSARSRSSSATGIVVLVYVVKPSKEAVEFVGQHGLGVER